MSLSKAAWPGERGWLVPDRRRGPEHGEVWYPLLRAYWDVKDAIEMAIAGTAGTV
jgi:hypothetical protein